MSDTPVATPWQERMRLTVDIVRSMSSATDPQQMVREYGTRVRALMPLDGHLSLSRRGLDRPRVRITRSSRWTSEVNPWTDRDALPLIDGGILSQLLYDDEPRILNDFVASKADPAYDYLAGMRSLVFIPHYHQGTALNAVVHLRKQPGAFSQEQFPDLVMMSNLFGRATQNLVLTGELKAAYESLDRELKAVEEIQRSLLPPSLPKIPALQLAAFYQTSQRAGGDYYDLFPLPDGQYGIFIADVSGHGTPAAVVMAITHTIAHTFPGPPMPPSRMLAFVNARLSPRYTGDLGTFVTAFYGVYSPVSRTLTYACAGHNPPRLGRKGHRVLAMGDHAGLPLGIMENETYRETVVPLEPGDTLLFYTDGITETFDAHREMFGVERLDEVLLQDLPTAQETLDAVLKSLGEFSQYRPGADDRTLLVAKVV